MWKIPLAVGSEVGQILVESMGMGTAAGEFGSSDKGG